MAAKTTSELRGLFLNYFHDNGHEIVPSSPLVPANDPTLLFTNAGMVQFKEVFQGHEERPYKRAVSSQRCVRAGGKHNDLENVGHTARHHTFFEMLGNFSFGDYFKHEAIGYAWTFLTEVLELPEDKLWISVFESDDETAEIWQKEIGVDPNRLARYGEKDNFWAMGPTGPCGPCTEIFYDHGADVPGSPPGGPEEDGDRYIEIWNLVFTQYDRDEQGKLNPIPRPCVDTGMGLERLAAVMQGVHNNYDIDSFQHLIQAIMAIGGEKNPDRTSLRVVADHIRSCAFIIVDGVMPSNEGRGYVLRRIIRRAVRHGHKLGFREPFFHRLVGPLAQEMGDAYPELIKAQDMVERVLNQEEQRFADTLEQGLKVLENAICQMSGETIAGSDVFQLYDTYGFPVDLTADIARERGFRLDMDGFEKEMQAQRERARAASRFHVCAEEIPQLPLDKLSNDFTFTGYEQHKEAAKITGLYLAEQPVETMSAGQTGVVTLDKTPFYAESGGQVGDTGQIQGPEGAFTVDDTQKQGPVHLHIGSVKRGKLRRGDLVEATIDSTPRAHTVLNHSATHLLHAALRTVLGEHVVQKGSLVAPNRLRFDFSHHEPVSRDEMLTIEDLVNREIRANQEVQADLMPMQRALESGALALFGEKYGDTVRVLRMGDFSIELCGGTHVQRTGDIGLFKLTAESGVAAGVRRLEAVTGETALNWLHETEMRLQRVEEQVKGNDETVVEKVEQLVNRARTQEKEIHALKVKLSSQSGDDLTSKTVEINGVKVVAATLEEADAGTLRESVDRLKSKLGTAAVVLASVTNGKVRLVAGVTRETTKQLNASNLVNFVATQVDGKGGGRPDLAQAGGNDPDKLDAALAGVPDWVREQLGES